MFLPSLPSFLSRQEKRQDQVWLAIVPSLEPVGNDSLPLSLSLLFLLRSYISLFTYLSIYPIPTIDPVFNSHSWILHRSTLRTLPSHHQLLLSIIVPFCTCLWNVNVLVVKGETASFDVIISLSLLDEWEGLCIALLIRGRSTGGEGGSIEGGDWVRLNACLRVIAPLSLSLLNRGLRMRSEYFGSICGERRKLSANEKQDQFHGSQNDREKGGNRTITDHRT